MKKLIRTLSLFGVILCLLVPFVATASANSLTCYIAEQDENLNEQDNFIKEYLFIEDEEIVYDIVLTFNEAGLPIRLDRYTGDEKTLENYKTIEYTSENTATILDYWNDELTSQSEITFSDDYLITETKEYIINEAGSLELNVIVTYTYDENGNMLSEIISFVDDEDKNSSTFYTYEGNLLVEELSETSKRTYTYDELGREISMVYSYRTSSDVDFIAREIHETSFDDTGLGTCYRYTCSSSGERQENAQRKIEINYTQVAGQYLISQEVWYDVGDGGDWEYYSTSKYTYNEEGCLVKSESNEGGFEDVITWTYQPTPREEVPQENASVALIVVGSILVVIGLYVCAYCFLFKKGKLTAAFFAKFFLPMDKLVSALGKKSAS